VSAASITPPAYLMPMTEVPVTIGRVVRWLPGAAGLAVFVPGMEARVVDPPAAREKDMIRCSSRSGVVKMVMMEMMMRCSNTVCILLFE